jgi:predicted DNA-binding transcriptional regulator YafY
MVAARGDPALRRAAEDLVAKIAAVIPESLRPLVAEPATRAEPSPNDNADAIDMAALRQAIRAGQKVEIAYRDREERTSLRRIWPFAVGYQETSRLIMAWCELRADFRSFRTDRVERADFTGERYPERPAILRARWRRDQQARWAAWKPAEGER